MSSLSLPTRTLDPLSRQSIVSFQLGSRGIYLHVTNSEVFTYIIRRKSNLQVVVHRVDIRKPGHSQSLQFVDNRPRIFVCFGLSSQITRQILGRVNTHFMEED